MNEQGSSVSEFQLRAAASSGGRWFSKKARAFSGEEKVALRSLSLGWWMLSSGMKMGSDVEVRVGVCCCCMFQITYGVRTFAVVRAR